MQAATPRASESAAAASGLDVDPIVGGQIVAAGQFPSVVAIVVDRLLCTGTLLSPNLIVTAAHCFQNSQPNATVSVYVGDRRDPSQVFTRSQQWAQHPAYCGLPDCGDEAYDFAYVVLEEPINLAAYPQPLLTPQAWQDHMQVDSPTLLVGFGNDESGPQTDKRFTYTNLTWFTEGHFQFRAGGDGKDSCDGDSGGPAFVEMADGQTLIAGVLSAGSEVCGKGGMYGSMIAVVPWLTQTAGYVPPPGSCLDTDCLIVDDGSDTGTGDEEADDESDGCRTAGSSDRGATTSLLALLLLGLRRRRRLESKPRSVV